jgi:hypothetical protein
MLKNPFLVYIASFGAVLVIYQLGWSSIYPELSWDLLVFFALTFLAAFWLACLITPFINRTQDYTPGLLPRYTGLFVIATFAAEILLAGGIPLLFIMDGVKFYELEANAIHLHAFTLWSVFSAIRFADFLYSRRYLYMTEAALPVIFYGLLVYRGPAVMCILSWIFVFVIKQGDFKLKHGTAIAVALLSVFYINGVIGDARSPGQERAGAPSASFRNSGIPQTYFWTYLYTTLPMANFQLSVNKLAPGQGTVAEFVASEFLPDTFSKRLLPHLNPQIASGSGNLASRDMLYSWPQPQISPGLNTSTLFGRAYGFFGWIGPVIMFLALSALVILYVILIRASPYRVPALALLNVLVVFCLFNNMIASAAIIPQLVWPLLLPPWRYQLKTEALKEEE